jgi:7,8-dihydropterin-6-yl-methyl-4-(beta-D-ribofuranosyl)aminobenzene 5'-phosphate synthase
MTASAPERPSAITATLLVDDQATQGLMSEHGFSAWIELAGRHLLFDTGQGTALEVNADKLGIDLRQVDVLVLSHGHYDHTGGVPLVVERAPGVGVYAHPAVMGPRFSIREGAAKVIALPAASRSALESLGSRVRWTTQPLQLGAYMGLSGPIMRLTDYEDTGGPFFIDADGKQRDPIDDDLALWLRTDRGLLVIVGCSHAGLVNSLRHALQSSGERKLHAVVGGFHLNEASETRLDRTTAELAELAPDLIVPCHCTGEAAVQRLEHSFGERIVRGHAGSVLQFEAARTPSPGRAAAEST